MSTLTVSREDTEERDSSLLQRAIDSASRNGGGVVEIPAGVYQLHDALHLRSNVKIIGEPGTILKPIYQRRSELIHLVGYGFHEFQVREPDKFGIGTGVLIMDDNAFGFYMTSATIIDQKDDVFFTDRPMVHDYNPAKGGCVISAFPLISGIGVHNVAVRQITLQGNQDEEVFPRAINGCRGGGIYLLQTHGVEVEKVDIGYYNGDGVSFQQCTDITVRDCHLHHNHGCGIHPGSGSVRYWISGNKVVANDGCGIFYCLRTTHSLCEGNTILGNGRDGISIGERDTSHVVRDNTIAENKGAGILFREPLIQSGEQTRLEGNQVSMNGDPRGELVIAAGLRDILVLKNVFESPEGNPPLYVSENCRNIILMENTVNRRSQNESDIQGDHTGLCTSICPEDFPQIGPEAADDFRHLASPPPSGTPRNDVSPTCSAS
jgi:hypothetical protein